MNHSGEDKKPSSQPSPRGRRGSKCSGFTLIELSIVLVIIGLIIGGVLVGRDLIRVAEVRKTISEIEKTNTAVNTFRGKYNCLAGDCANATQFFGAGAQPDQTSNGDGNGVVNNNANDTTGGFISSELAFFFDHLANAKLISLATFDEAAADMNNITAGAGYPKIPIGKGFIVYNALPACCTIADIDWIESGNHAFLLSVESSIVDQFVNTADVSNRGFITAPDAFSIDSKIDDGKPRLGKVRALLPTTGDDAGTTGYLSQPAAPGSGSCASNASGEPYSSNNNDTCALSIKATF